MIVAGSSAPDRLAQAVERFRGGGDTRAFLASPGTLSLVAVEGDALAGWCWGYYLVRPDGFSMAYMHELTVEKGHRRQGIGRGLVEAFMANARARGATRLFLSTGADNRIARHLYESMGGGLAEQGATVNYWFQLDHPDRGVQAATSER